MKKYICLILLLSCISFVNAGDYTIKVDGNDTGRAYEGIGAINAGGNGRLLIDYPEPSRSQILDYLFKPNFGASFEHLKVEIGSGQNSTSGAVPSHAYTDAEIKNPVSRGYQLWFMKEALKRNPDIITDCLAWGIPACTDGLWTSDMADYIVSFVRLAKEKGIEMDWVAGCVNECGTDNSWIKKDLRPVLDKAGFKDVKIQANEAHGHSMGWTILSDCMEDPNLDKVVDAVTSHYVEDTNDWPTPEQIAHGKPMWDSEQTVADGNWKWSKSIVITMIRDYIEGRITKQQIWCPVDSCADGLFAGGVGAMQADEPWSGNYVERPALWAIAHFTQFADPGWKFLDSGCGYLSGKGCYATVYNTKTDDYSIIIYTENQEDITVKLSGGVSTGTVYDWRSRDSKMFQKTKDIKPSDGSFKISIPADRIVSLTTTTGQKKGSYPTPVPMELRLPYRENFERYSVGDMAKYLSDNQGTFIVQKAKGGRDGNALQQIVPETGYAWSAVPKWTMTVIPGPLTWENYELSGDVYIESGEVYLAVRKGYSSWAQVGLNCGYAFVLEKDGSWRLQFDDPQDKSKMIKSGKLAKFDSGKWHNVKVCCLGDEISSFVDGKEICKVKDDRRTSGNACFGGSFDFNQYDNIKVKTVRAESK